MRLPKVSYISRQSLSIHDLQLGEKIAITPFQEVMRLDTITLCLTIYMQFGSKSKMNNMRQMT